MMRVFLGLVIFAGICLLYLKEPVWVLIYGAIVNVWTFLVFALDKLSAVKGWWRTPENTLHFYAALGASPAVLLGEVIIGHKRSKSSFNRVFYTVVILQILIIGGLVYWKMKNP